MFAWKSINAPTCSCLSNKDLLLIGNQEYSICVSPSGLFLHFIGVLLPWSSMPFVNSVPKYAGTELNLIVFNRLTIPPSGNPATESLRNRAISDPLIQPSRTRPITLPTRFGRLPSAETPPWYSGARRIACATGGDMGCVTGYGNTTPWLDGALMIPLRPLGATLRVM